MKEINENTLIPISIKNIIGIAISLAALIGMYFSLKAEIVEAKELPLPNITQEEVLFQDELIRSAIINTEKEVTQVKSDITEIKETLNKLDERLYRLGKQ